MMGFALSSLRWCLVLREKNKAKSIDAKFHISNSILFIAINKNVSFLFCLQNIILVVIKLKIYLVGYIEQMPLGSNKLGSLLNIDN
jgi:hypothetical protein